jgi:hypothetical protein
MAAQEHLFTSKNPVLEILVGLQNNRASAEHWNLILIGVSKWLSKK